MSCTSFGLIGDDNKISNDDGESTLRASHARDLAIRDHGRRKRRIDKIEEAVGKSGESCRR